MNKTMLLVDRGAVRRQIIEIERLIEEAETSSFDIAQEYIYTGNGMLHVLEGLDLLAEPEIMQRKILETAIKVRKRLTRTPTVQSEHIEKHYK